MPTLTDSQRATVANQLRDVLDSLNRLVNSRDLRDLLREWSSPPMNPKLRAHAKLWAVTESAPRSNLNLSAALANGGVHTYEELMEHTDDLQQIRGVGPKVASLLEAAIATFDPEEWERTHK